MKLATGKIVKAVVQKSRKTDAIKRLRSSLNLSKQVVATNLDKLAKINADYSKFLKKVSKKKKPSASDLKKIKSYNTRISKLIKENTKQHSYQKATKTRIKNRTNELKSAQIKFNEAQKLTQKKQVFNQQLDNFKKTPNKQTYKQLQVKFSTSSKELQNQYIQQQFAQSEISEEYDSEETRMMIYGGNYKGQQFEGMLQTYIDIKGKTRYKTKKVK